MLRWSHALCSDQLCFLSQYHVRLTYLVEMSNHQLALQEGHEKNIFDMSETENYSVFVERCGTHYACLVDVTSQDAQFNNITFLNFQSQGFINLLGPLTLQPRECEKIRH